LDNESGRHVRQRVCWSFRYIKATEKTFNFGQNKNNETYTLPIKQFWTLIKLYFKLAERNFVRQSQLIQLKWKSP
jgi:hypothetical protein